MTRTADDIADRLFSAIEQNVTVLSWVIGNLADRSYEEVRRQATTTGFVQQHVLRFTRTDGTRQEVPACLVVACDLEAGTITRIDEYLDSAHIARITG